MYLHLTQIIKGTPNDRISWLHLPYCYMRHSLCLRLCHDIAREFHDIGISDEIHLQNLLLEILSVRMVQENSTTIFLKRVGLPRLPLMENCALKLPL